LGAFLEIIMRRGFTLVELLVVIAIIAILVSIAISQYLRHSERTKLVSYALPRARACMADVASYCSTDPPSAGTETYSIIGNSVFPNYVANHTTPGGTVYFTVVEAFQCSNTGQLVAGKLYAYFSATGQRVVCQVDVRPFRCFVE
jgi:type IV pilus assembly protein PilA